jgi:transcription antitermination factor NusG
MPLPRNLRIFAGNSNNQPETIINPSIISSLEALQRLNRLAQPRSMGRALSPLRFSFADLETLRAMPILPAEPALFPGNLFDGAAEAPERVWWVLHVKPRQEKSLARHLYGQQVPFYLPLTRNRLTIRGRPRQSWVPLFPGYVFVCGNAEERLTALAGSRVLRSLHVADQAGLWHDLRQVHQLIASGAPITREERLLPGTAVEIHEGPLAGLRGTILRGASGRRFVVQVNFIQQGASVLLHHSCLTALHE